MAREAESSVRLHGERESTPTTPAVNMFIRTSEKSERGNPASAQPMPGLSKRAQALLAPKRQCFNVPIEPAGGGLERFAKSKAAI